MFTAGVITLSDSAVAGQRQDLSGPLLVASLEATGFLVKKHLVLPDDLPTISQALIQFADEDGLDLVLTTGGTGFGPRDVTPEATLAVLHKLAPGIAEAIRAASLKITPRAMLSRAVSGIRNRTLIINLPGSPKAAEESLAAVLATLEHGLAILTGKAQNCARS